MVYHPTEVQQAAAFQPGCAGRAWWRVGGVWDLWREDEMSGPERRWANPEELSLKRAGRLYGRGLTLR
ncbi:MAG: hypothetical protein KY464_16005, partial [Gemmatimonadetes bacterium]|nr:hypothetical protein [Gemmatimonadota bacterium]